jgi:hypothetical protein
MRMAINLVGQSLARKSAGAREGAHSGSIVLARSANGNGLRIVREAVYRADQQAVGLVVEAVEEAVAPRPVPIIARLGCKVALTTALVRHQAVAAKLTVLMIHGVGPVRPVPIRVLRMKDIARIETKLISLVALPASVQTNRLTNSVEEEPAA